MRKPLFNKPRVNYFEDNVRVMKEKKKGTQKEKEKRWRKNIEKEKVLEPEIEWF